MAVQALTPDASSTGGGVAGEILAKHSRSQQPESVQLCAAVTAILDVVAAQSLQPTPTVLFAAVMSSLERAAADDDHSDQVGLPV